MTRKYILTAAECLAKGGHVWDPGVPYTVTSFGLSIPSKESPEYRRCLYCGALQRGYYPPEVWEDGVESIEK